MGAPLVRASLVGPTLTRTKRGIASFKLWLADAELRRGVNLMRKSPMHQMSKNAPCLNTSLIDHDVCHSCFSSTIVRSISSWCPQLANRSCNRLLENVHRFLRRNSSTVLESSAFKSRAISLVILPFDRRRSPVRCLRRFEHTSLVPCKDTAFSRPKTVLAHPARPA